MILDVTNDFNCISNICIFGFPCNTPIKFGKKNKKSFLISDKPSAKDLKTRVQHLCDFANQSSNDSFLHPVIKGIILHFWLAYEHPFVDGNGRTSRALLYWFLLKNNYWLIEYLPVSRIILKAPSKYKMAFIYSEEDDLDLTYFLVFNLRALCLSLDDFKKYILRKQKEIINARVLLKNIPGLNERQQELIHHALNNPGTVYTISWHKSKNGIAYQTARTDLMDLVGKKLFILDDKGRSYRYYPHPELTKKLE